MFNLGIGEMAAIALLALLLIGPKQLPEMARTLGRLLNELRRTTNSFTSEFRETVKFDQRKIFDMNMESENKRNHEEAHNQAMKAQQPPPPAPAPTHSPAPSAAAETKTDSSPDGKKS